MSDAAVIPLAEPGWTVDPREWLAAVRERWPEARLEPHPDPEWQLAAYAVLPTVEGPLDVMLNQDRCTVKFEPLLPGPIAEVVEWWARRLPSYEPPVHFFVIADASRSLPIEPDTSAAEVLAFMNR